MEKRRVRLEINGVVCGVITEETNEYMAELSNDISDLMNQIMAASPFITKESAAVTAALSYLDTAKKAEIREQEKRRKNAELEKRNLELERQAAQLRKENNRLTDEAAALFKQIETGVNGEERSQLEGRIADLELQLARLKKQEVPATAAAQTADTAPAVKLRNPLRHPEWEKGEFVSFFEKNEKKN